MARYRLTRQAERDYREILAFTLDRWGVEQFERYAKLLDNAFERLIVKPLGIRRDDVRSGYLSYRVGQHYIFYRVHERDVEIARILHVKRKVTKRIF